MNIGSTLSTIALLQLMLSAPLAVSAGVGLVYGEYEVVMAFAVPIVGMVGSSLIIRRIFRKDRARVLLTKDGFLFVTLSWVFASLWGALPFWISGEIPRFTDAFFETISGFTTTGASILVDIERLPRSLLFWRSLTHWLGGMGIVVLTVAILPRMGIGGLKVIRTEVPGPTIDKLTPRIAETAKILWGLYTGLSVAQAVLLMIAGMDWFDAVTHTFGTLATGGFSPKGASVGQFQSVAIDVIITVFMIAAGINFSLYFRIARGGWSDFFANIELRAYLTIFVVACAVVSFTLIDRYGSLLQALRFGSFQVASILTTTGYTTADYTTWPQMAQAVLLALMFVGGCSGSTGGGIKVVRLVALFKQGVNELKYLVHPRGIFPTNISDRPVKKDVLFPIAVFFFLYVWILLITTLVVASAGTDLLSAFSSALATVGNIGPGFGAVGPSATYAYYPDYVKWFLSLAMLTGRLELYSVLILLTPSFWRR